MNRLEKSGLEIVAKLMAISARTTPKTGGIDHIQIMIANSNEQKSIADMMYKIGEETCNKSANKKLGNAIKKIGKVMQRL